MKEFAIKNLREYTELYMLLDATLLMDVFEDFRDMTIKEYKLDPANYLSLPSLAYDILFYTSKQTVENVTDIDMFIMLEKAKRGGLCTIGADRLCAPNNKYVKGYNPNNLSMYGLYIDANGLYPTAMCMPLPTGGYNYENNLEIFNEEYIKSIPEDGIRDGDIYRGYMFDLDGYYPDEVHDRLNDYVPLPENKVCDLSPHMKEMANKMGIKMNKQKKLICTLDPKTHYSVHYAELKSALRWGFKITKIHRVMSFIQSRWMASYVTQNQNKRKLATNKASKDFFKMLNNAVYGKTMENVRNRRDIRLTTDEKKKQKLVNSPWYKGYKDFSNGLHAVEMAKKKVVMNKPIAIGVAILAWSKAHMFDAYYGVIKPKYNDRVSMHYTDTDSMILSIQTEDLYKDMAEDLEFTSIFDLGTYKADHPIFNFGNKEALQDLIKKNKDILGKFKDESEGEQLTQMCFLKAKMYSLSKQGASKPIIKAKGIKKSAMKELTKQMYINCLLSDKKEDLLRTSTFQRISSNNHKLTTKQQTKKSISHLDDKRHYTDALHSRAHGHWRNKLDITETK